MNRNPEATNKVVITQSNYIPWKGYFDMMNRADVFVVYDDMQYTKRDWRNRNLIKVPTGTAWLTIPVEVKGKYFQKIKDTRISDPSWNKRHWDTLKQAYAKAGHFEEMAPLVQEAYMTATSAWLTEINLHFIEFIRGILGIKNTIRMSSEFDLAEDRNERLLNICKTLGATHYISGPAAKAYMEVGIFEKSHIEVEWMDYSGYPEYEQLHVGFEHGVSIVDLLFNQGWSIKRMMKTFNVGY